MHKRTFRPSRLALPAAVVVLLALCAAAALTPRVYARIMQNTIDKNATISADGSHIIVTGPIQCDQEQEVQMRVTVTQRSTGAIAEVEWTFQASGDGGDQTWTAVAPVLGNDFEEGKATVVALAISTVDGVADDAAQWTKKVDLVAE